MSVDMSNEGFISRSRLVNEVDKRLRQDLKRVSKPETQTTESQLLYLDTILDIHRQAFECLLSNVLTFKPQLLQIRDAYEKSIAFKNKVIKNNAVLLKALSKDRENNKLNYEQIDEERSQLKSEIETLTTELDELKQKCLKLEKEALENHLALSVERDARHALSIENSKLKSENNRLSDRQSNKIQDPVVTKLALDHCRKDLSKVNSMLSKTLEEYSDAVPKSDYEKLEIDCMQKSDDVRDMKRQMNSLRNAHESLKDEHEKLKEDTMELKDIIHDLEETGTPRPKWDTCAEFIGGGTTRWKQLTRGLSSRRKLEIILKELGPTSQRSNSEYFQGFGFDPIIPEYLQYEGEVRNLKLSRRDMNILINDIWSAKAVEHKSLTMQDFLKIYFEERYEQKNVRAEWAYNLYSGCEQTLEDQQIKLFWGVLHGSLSEDIYYSYKKEWSDLKQRVTDDCQNEQGTITLEDVEKSIRKTFPLKTDIDFKNLTDAVKKQMKIKHSQQAFEIDKLFSEDEEGFQRTDFAKELYRQRRTSQEKYVREIILQLGGAKNYTKPITVENLKRAFAIIDPHIDHIIMESNIRWVYADKNTNVNMIYPLSLKTIANKLMSGNINRVGPRYRGRYSRGIKA